ncbi:hypothetical protein GCM10009780_03900 [Actinomadura alba]
MPVTRTRADVPAGLEGLVIELLAKEPARRPVDAISVGDRLMTYVDKLPPLPGLIDRFSTPLHLYATALERITRQRSRT